MNGFSTMVAVTIVMMFRINIISTQQILRAKPLKCPKSTYYAIADNIEPYTINAQHPNNPTDTEYEWEILSTDGINESHIMTNGEDTDTFWIVNEAQYGEIKLKLTMRHATRSTTPCIIKLIYQPAPYFGIDLGTTFSCIAYQYPDINYHTNKRQTKIIIADTSSKRQYCIPTAVYFPQSKKDKLLFGYDARHKLSSDNENVIFDIKRIIGRQWNDPEVQQFANSHPFKITTEDEKNIRILIPNRNTMISPEQALAVILRHLISVALKEVNIVTDNAINVVISIPAFFYNGQRRAIQSAAKLANLDAKVLVVEPTAAAIAHIYYSSVPADNAKLFLVFDYGGGTLDCSIMRCIGLECDVLAVSGNSTLGGIDYDHVIKDIIIQKLVNTYNINSDSIDKSKLLEDSEMIKISLSTNTQHLYKYKNKPTIIIKRKEFENHPRTKQLMKSAIDTAKKAMEQNDPNNPKFVASNIRMLLMIGGSSNIPIIQKKLREAFPRDTLKLEFPEIDPQLMVITGSAVLAGSMVYDKKFTVADVIPLPLGFEVCTFKENDCGNMNIIVEKNTPYPLELNRSYCQVDAKETTAVLNLYEGENKKVIDNHFISRLVVRNILPRNKSVCNTLHAVFQIDKNGIVTIHGVSHKKDGSDGNVYTMSLSLSTDDGSVSKTDLKRMKSEMDSWFMEKKQKAKTAGKDKSGFFGFQWLFKQKEEL